MRLCGQFSTHGTPIPAPPASLSHKDIQALSHKDIQAPTSWYGLISGRTLCTATRNFSCVTGDCQSGQIECPNRGYSWAPVTYAYFRLDNNGGFDSYTVSVEHGYNLPIVVVPSQRSNGTCIPAGCVVDNLNNTCPENLKDIPEETLVGCSSSCRKSQTPETCCINDYRSKETCNPTLYTTNFENACPRAYVYAYHDHVTTFNCPSSTDYVITFCPSSFSPNNNTISNDRSSKVPAPLAEKKNDSQRTLKIILGVSTALAVIIIIVSLGVIVRAKSTRGKSHWNDNNIEAAVMLKRYSYENVKTMTNSFDHVLGKGGFGTVYKGKLLDASGREIALKVLKESKGNGEEFINELASMSRASHVNIVSLYGFCYEGDNRAIIYEFMPNGSLDKFISENMSTNKDWKMLYNIAVGVARGLEYLHNSCVSKIVHFDIKPQNILMDEDFGPKISDFGLAKLCKPKDSVISLLDARGTIGYIAPELFSTNFGGVSNKSDVYSYGMVILEMIGAKNIQKARSNNSSMYFPHWIYEDLEREESMKLYGDHINEEEKKIVKKMTLVGLWCIQTNPSDRPPMRKVVEMLEGSLEALQVPPKPLLSLHATRAWESVEDSQGTSTFSTPNHLERRTL